MSITRVPYQQGVKSIFKTFALYILGIWIFAYGHFKHSGVIDWADE